MQKCKNNLKVASIIEKLRHLFLKVFFSEKKIKLESLYGNTTCVREISNICI